MSSHQVRVRSLDVRFPSCSKLRDVLDGQDLTTSLPFQADGSFCASNSREEA
eukprot:CAMPEP_0206635554 /NCGR_PEP_ID=MMETSP0325_2-20121206/70627_1 /ASSEMBLY_ACC=CAM_ASM_000347 /TAXON_ID=2866 /ORGANISM="Crypthecodinium cohnii, Strain Seligo" /LENGTH=51 /DNA_ID=CAMNT_0054161405 /DNA_START=276 /DNA_END=431 /DNA_ORIENTATION=+